MMTGHGEHASQANESEQPEVALRTGFVFLVVLFTGLAFFVMLFTATRARRLTSDNPSNGYEGTALDQPAADFQLTDQHGDVVRLSDFRGLVVVLTFMDSRCEETCPLTAIQLWTTSQALGDKAGSVVFLAVNVNTQASAVEDVAIATRQWQLDEIPAWHFLTGSAEELQPVWQAYNVLVLEASPEETGELQHTPGVYLIDPIGRVRWYVSTPYNETGTPQWTAPLSDLLVKHILELSGEGYSS